VSPRLLVIAKEPVPGLVKTRLCPPCTPAQAAAVAAASLADTVRVLDTCPASRRVLVLSGRLAAPPGWDVLAQRGNGLAERLHHAFIDSGRGPALLVGMDTPQLTPALIGTLAAPLADADAVLGPAADGGWWGLALRDPTAAEALRGVPMSTVDTGRRTVAALRANGLRVVAGPVLRDVDTAADAWAVASQCPLGDFAAAVRIHVPVPASAVRA
jgi:glycosyltransferase A (GT-A) superfamily protein (DUF2064 family)